MIDPLVLNPTARDLIDAVNDLIEEVNTGVGGGIQSVVAGTNITIDNTDPSNPVISSSGGGPIIPTITTDTTLNVPADYATINAALSYALSAVVLNGAEITIAVDGTTYTCNEQITLNNLDIPYITIKATSPVSVDTTGFAVNTPFGQPAFMFLQNCNPVIVGMWNHSAGTPCLGAIFAACNVTMGDLTYTASGLTGFVYNLYVYGGEFLGLGIVCSGAPINADVKFEAAFVYIDRLTITSGAGIVPLDVNGSTVKITATGQTITATNTLCVDIQSSTFHMDAMNLVTGNTNTGININNSTATIKNSTITHDCYDNLVLLTNSNATLGLAINNTTANSPNAFNVINSTARILSSSTGTTCSGLPVRVQSGGIAQVSNYSALAAKYTGALLTPLNMPTGDGLILAPQQGWTPPTLLNGWTDIVGWQAAQYRKVGDMVEIRMSVENGTATGLFNLPVGFRPPANISFSCNVHDNANAPEYGHLVIESNGDVYLEHPGTLSSHKVYAVVQFSVLA